MYDVVVKSSRSISLLLMSFLLQVLFSLVCGEHGHWSAVVCGGSVETLHRTNRP